MAAVPGFKSSCQSSSAAPFQNPPKISYTFQHPCILPAYWAAIVSLGRCGPMVWSQSSLSAQVTVTGWGELPPSYILGGSRFHPPGSKHGHSYLTYLCNQLKVIDMLNDHARGYLQSCCCTKQLLMALLHVSHPPAQTGGGEGILYLIFSNIS